MQIITDPVFYYAAVPAVMLMGLSKGGLGGALVLMGVPILSLVVSPVKAAAILLPVLLMMDAVALHAWRGFYDKQLLKDTLPGAVVGIAIGWATAAFVSDDMVRLLVGMIALAFTIQFFLRRHLAAGAAQPHNSLKGNFWGSMAGFTSFVSHAGAPPFQIYALPLKLDPKAFTGSATIFFTANNVIKLLPYWALGQLSFENVATSVMLFPAGALATVIGAMIVKRMNAAVFYPFMYVMVALVGAKMLYDGATALLF